MNKLLRFEVNVPVEVSFSAEDYKPDEDCVEYHLTDGRLMRLSTEVAASINMLEIGPGESFVICKRWNGERREFPHWDVWLTPQTERDRAAASSPDLEQQLRESLAAQGISVDHAGRNGSGDQKSADEIAGKILDSLENGKNAERRVSAPRTAPLALTTASILQPGVNSESVIESSNGTHGPQAIPMPSKKLQTAFHPVPMNVAFREFLETTLEGLKVCNQSWGPAEVQDVVVTMLIQAGQKGWLGPWERKS